MTSKLSVDTIQGVSQAGSITVQGEGTAETNLQQGLAKAFVHGDVSASVVASQSFNIGSGTDHGTGDFSFAITSAMASADYLGFVTPNANGSRNGIHYDTRNTSSVLALIITGDDGSNSDKPYNACSLGDLA